MARLASLLGIGLGIAIVVLAGCAHAPARETLGPIAPGLAIAVYMRADATTASIDDRRYVDVHDGAFELIDIDPAIALSALMLESPALTIGPCTRARTSIRVDDEPAPVPTPTPASDDDDTDVDAPVAIDKPAVAPATKLVDKPATTVRCHAHGATGRQLVRVGYVTSALSVQARHEVEVAIVGDTAHVVTRVIVSTPAKKLDDRWQQADLAVFDGTPGGPTPAGLIARGRIVLDGALATIEGTRREVRAQVRRVLEIRSVDADVPAKPISNVEDLFPKDTHSEVWVAADLPTTHLVPGPVHVRVLGAGGSDRGDVREVDASDVHLVADTLRLPLWIDGELTATHDRSTIPSSGTLLEERYINSIVNAGSVAREVWIEQTLRPARRRAVVHATPSKPSRAGDVLRSKLTIAPGARERVMYTVVYDL